MNKYILICTVFAALLSTGFAYDEDKLEKDFIIGFIGGFYLEIDPSPAPSDIEDISKCVKDKNHDLWMNLEQGVIYMRKGTFDGLYKSLASYGKACDLLIAGATSGCSAKLTKWLNPLVGLCNVFLRPENIELVKGSSFKINSLELRAYFVDADTAFMKDRDFTKFGKVVGKLMRLMYKD
jgi:hypothetical protein